MLLQKLNPVQRMNPRIPNTTKSVYTSVTHCTSAAVVKSRTDITVTRQLPLFLSSACYDVTNLIGYGSNAERERLPREPAGSNIRNATVLQVMKLFFPFWLSVAADVSVAWQNSPKWIYFRHIIYRKTRFPSNIVFWDRYEKLGGRVSKK
jgi:hypothetical protein